MCWTRTRAGNAPRSAGAPSPARLSSHACLHPLLCYQHLPARLATAPHLPRCARPLPAFATLPTCRRPVRWFADGCVAVVRSTTTYPCGAPACLCQWTFVLFYHCGQTNTDNHTFKRYSIRAGLFARKLALPYCPPHLPAAFRAPTRGITAVTPTVCGEVEEHWA